MQLTPEQAAVRDAATTGKNLIVEAGAGAGKTSTLKAAADAMLAEKTAKRGLYIGFNKVTADEAKAKFPSAFDCRTGHSLAFASHGRALGHKLPGPRGRRALSMIDTAKALKLDAVLLDAATKDDESRWLQPDTLARLALTTVERFYRSDRDEIDARSLPFGLTPPGVSVAQFNGAVLDAAARMWDDHRHVNGALQLPHDAYRKMWALSRPTLRADVVMLDEAQDTAPVLAKLVQDQAMQQIVVGDGSQQLYRWAGSVDSLANWKGADLRLSLTQSFRFGPAVAAEANKWLALLGKSMRLTGWDAIPSELAELGDTAKAVLCRTNVGALGEVVGGMSAGRKVALVGGGKEILAVAYAARDLKNGRRTDHHELCVYNSWDEVVREVQRDESSPLRPLVQMVERFGPDMLIYTVRQLVDEKVADMIVSTGHKAKGREWESVRICEDFATKAPTSEDDDAPVMAAEDMMLAYVAVTRAKVKLDRGPLDVVDTL